MGDLENPQSTDKTNSSSEMSAKDSASTTPDPAVHSGSGEGSKKKMLIIGAAVAVVLLAGGLAAYMMMGNDKKEAEKPKPSFKVGVLLPFSGGASGSGFGELKGVQLAKKQLGADNIELIQADSKCDADEAVKAIKELIAKGVVAIVGEACSGASLGALPEANTAQIPLVSPSASSPGLSIANDYFFRVIPPDQFQGAFTAKLLYEKGLKNVAVLNTDESYGNSLAEVFKAELEKLGGKVVSAGKFASDEIKLKTQVDALKAANPQAIYLISNSSPSAIAALKLVRAAGVTAPFYGADSINDNAILSEAQDAGEGLTVTTFSAGTKAFKQALTNEYPSEEFLYAAAEGYDAFAAIYKALEAGAATGAQVKTQLAKIDFTGVSGRIKFNAAGELTDAEHAYDIVVAKDGTFVPAEE
jgi:branched-chain amino acid transport system substrate-binding protein